MNELVRFFHGISGNIWSICPKQAISYYMRRSKYLFFCCLCLLTLMCSSCFSSNQGYMAAMRAKNMDCRHGVAPFSFQNFDVDTIQKGQNCFEFPENIHSPFTSFVDTAQLFRNNGERLTVNDWAQKVSDSYAMLVIQNDSIVYKVENCGFSVDTDVFVFSITKAITSLLCGIAVDEGYIKSTSDPVTDYLPELKNKDAYWSELKILHLLEMQAGFDFK